MNNTDKIFVILNEIYEQDLKILPPDINYSDYKFVVHEDKIIYGLAALKGVGEDSMKELVLKETKMVNLNLFQILMIDYLDLY